MIELTEQQVAQLAAPSVAPAQVVNPQTKETFVLLPLQDYERLKREKYDDRPWTRDELEASAWVVSEATEWEEYDDVENR